MAAFAVALATTPTASAQDPDAPALAPLGVPTRDVGTAEAPRELPASFRVRVALPSFLGAEVKLDLVSLGPDGEPIDSPGAVAGFQDGIPKTAFLGEGGLVLRRLSANPTDEGAHWYESDVVVAIADLRAARGYTRTPAENAANAPGACVRCDRAVLGIPADAREILSGETIRARYPPELMERLAPIYGEAALRAGEPSMRSVRWEMAPSLRQEPARSASGGWGDVVPGTLLHSGELTYGTVDLAVGGRDAGGIGFAFARSYRNQTIDSGPLGPGWDHAYRLRLRKLPDGKVELYDGSGRRETFTRQSDDSLKSPAGVFAELFETPQGYVLVDPAHTTVRFDVWGRLESIADAVKDRETTGSEVRFQYDRASHLTRVLDELGRAYDLDYDEAGRITSVSDFDGRTVRYEYDDEGRLARVTSPEVTVGESTFPNGLTTEYEYAETAPGSEGLAAVLATRDNLVAVHDARDSALNTPFEITYSDADGDGRAEEVTEETWGGHPLTIAYDFNGRMATVTDRREHPWQYQHNPSGQLLRFTDPTGAATAYAVDGEGLVTRVTAPLGRVTAIAYDTSGERRARGNVLSVSVTADSRGDNGSAHTLQTNYEYEGYANQPTEITDPRGAVTKIARNAVGLATSVTEAFGTPEAGTTTTQYNAFGQPTRVTNPLGHVTTYDYFATGPEQGYLQRQTVDPEGLALTTAFDVDERGNVLAVTDARGVRHESVYNELDWLVETTQAASGANSANDPEGLAPALGYKTHYLYDEVGQVIEERLPAGDDGASHTRVQRDYGVLGEVLEERREVTAGVFVTTSTEYDAAFQLIRVTSPEGNFEEWDYNSRNLLQFHRRGMGTGALPEPIQTEILYNAEGDSVGTIDGRGLGWARLLDGFGRPFRVANPLGAYEETTYDEGGSPKEIRRVASGSTLSRRVTELDPRGRPKSMTSYLWESAGDDPRIPDDAGGALALKTELTWDSASQLLQVTDPLERVTSAEYDAAGRRTAVLDSAGNRTAWQLDPSGNAREIKLQEKTPTGEVVEVVMTAAFDALSRPAAVEDAFGNSSRTIYDARGNVRLQIDAEGALTTATYDGLDRRTELARPEGILERFEYDDNGRLVAHNDALEQRTAYAYDAAGRTTSVTRPDGSQLLFETYDGNDNLLAWRDANGSQVAQLFDGANRLRGRSVERGPGVLGVSAEAFDYDGLSRLVRTQAGSIVASFAYDSLSRTTSETSDGRKTTYLRDNAGNALSMLYPSGLTVLRQFDELDRTRTVGTAGAPAGLAQFRYRGAMRPAGKDLGASILGRSSFDAAGRTTFRTATSPLASLLSEQTSYSPRGLATATTRWDLEGEGQIYRHDDAGRLLLTEEAHRAATAVGNNSVPEAATLESIETGFGFDYTPTDHMLLQAEKQAGAVAHTTLLPSDGSGRNRPAFANGKALTWDSNGNLIAKGSVHYEYDFHNRLVRVTEDGVGELASYDYDPLNRRVSRAVAGEEHPTVWSGWQAIEEYGDDGLEARRVYGLGLDEIVRAEVDLDDDGTVETTQRPIYDRIGNLVVLADELGKPVERYTYKPYGPQKTEADLTPPQLMQIRRSEFGTIDFDSSEGISGEALREALESGTPNSAIDIALDGLSV
ncbi:MAG: RHS repeat protein, partial [Thermoanaerobaculia bacterium]|nr:RHS repeat protein [Thermoanaerobaculia bacterium]